MFLSIITERCEGYGKQDNFSSWKEERGANLPENDKRSSSLIQGKATIERPAKKDGEPADCPENKRSVFYPFEVKRGNRKIFCIS